MKVNLNKANPQNYEIIFPKIPTEETMEGSTELTINIYESVIPSLTMEATPRYWQGGVAQYEAGSLTYEPWFVRFTVDSEFKNWLTLYKWMLNINNNKNKFSASREEYVVDATLKITDNNGLVVLKVDFINAWVNMLGEITLSQREGSRDLIASCNLMYDRYQISGV
jgi:hypothetical protein